MNSCDQRQDNSYTRDDDEPVFMAIGRDSPGLLEAIEKAGETLPDFIEAFQAGRHSDQAYVVKACFLGESEDDRAHIWVIVNQMQDNDLVCSPIQIPTGFTGLKEGELFLLKQDQVEDWMINVDGLIHGGYSLRLAREMTPESDRHEFDKHIGLQQFTDEKP
jgi:uncharacterized protein YegJ (DUF2314 family)